MGPKLPIVMTSLADQTKMVALGEEMLTLQSTNLWCTVSPNMVEARCKDWGWKPGRSQILAGPPAGPLTGTRWAGYHCLWPQFSHLKKADGGRLLYGSNKFVCTTVDPLCSSLLRRWGMVLGQRMKPPRSFAIFKMQAGQVSGNRHTRQAIYRRENPVNNDAETDIFNRERRYWKFKLAQLISCESSKLSA